MAGLRSHTSPENYKAKQPAPGEQSEERDVRETDGLLQARVREDEVRMIMGAESELRRAYLLEGWTESTIEKNGTVGSGKNKGGTGEERLG